MLKKLLPNVMLQIPSPWIGRIRTRPTVLYWPPNSTLGVLKRMSSLSPWGLRLNPVALYTRALDKPVNVMFLKLRTMLTGLFASCSKSILSITIGSREGKPSRGTPLNDFYSHSSWILFAYGSPWNLFSKISFMTLMMHFESPYLHFGSSLAEENLLEIYYFFENY